MSTRTGWAIVILLLLVIAGLAWFLFATPAPAQPSTTSTSTPATSTPGAATSAPLSASVTVTSPQPNASVGKTFAVAGQAPGPWFFEAIFPIQVRDKDGNAACLIFAELCAWVKSRGLTVPEYLADAALSRRYEETKAVLGVPWMGVVTIAFAHYRHFYDALWDGLRPIAESAPFVEGCAALRTFVEGEVRRLHPPPIAGRLEALGYTPARTGRYPRDNRHLL